MASRVETLVIAEMCGKLWDVHQKFQPKQKGIEIICEQDKLVIELNISMEEDLLIHRSEKV